MTSRQQSPGVETGALVAVGAATPSVDVRRAGRQRAGTARVEAKVARLRHALAERVVTTDERIQRELRGQAPLTMETVEECTRLLGLTIDEVLDGATVQEPSLFDAGEVLAGSDPWWRGPNLSVIETLAASGVDFAADHLAFMNPGQRSGPDRATGTAKSSQGPSVTVQVTTVNPVAEPASITTNRALQTAAAVGKFGH